jgi:pimeloyl-ACP methyl ester carboxylesterase
MLPFSVLRTWGLGLLSWSVLGLGVWMGYEAYQELTPTESRFVRDENLSKPANDGNPVEVEPRDRSDLRRNHVRTAPQDWRRWALLAGAALCLGTSVGGFWPVGYFFSNPAGQPRQTLQPVATRTLDRPSNSKLHIEIYGVQNAPTLLLTHGWSLNTTAWDYVKATLANRYRVVMWDLPGMGQSRGPDNGDYSLERMAADLASVLTATANGHPVVLVGHSIGGMILQTFARTQAKKFQNVQGLVLVHTTYTNPLRTNLFSSLTTALETPVIVPLIWLNIGLWPLVWLSHWQSYLNGSLHISTRITSFTGKQSRQQLDHGAWLAAIAHPAAVARGNLAMLKFNEVEVLPTLELPTLVLSGLHDRMTLPAASGHIEKLIPNDRPLSVNSGHLGHWELGDEVAVAILEFADNVRDAVSGQRHKHETSEPIA